MADHHGMHAPNEIPESVIRYIEQHALFKGIQRFVVGFSGGPDSTGTLEVMRELYDAVEAVHFNHHLRGPESDDDAIWCRRFCEVRNISFKVENLNIHRERRSRESIEMAARRLRLDYWRKRFTGKSDLAVVLGHQLNDRIENFLIRLIRGANATGLTGLRARTTIYGVTFLRPLLSMTRDAIVTLLNERGINDYRTDRTNHSDKHVRNKIRHTLVPALSAVAGTSSALGRSLDYLEQDAEYIESRAREILARRDDVLRVSDLRGMPVALWPRVIRQWIRSQTAVNEPIRGSIIRNLVMSMKRGEIGSAIFEVTSEHFIRIDHGRLTLQSNSAEFIPPAEISWHWRENPVLSIPNSRIQLRASTSDTANDIKTADSNVEYWDRNAVDEILLIRRRQAGDRMTPFGGDRSVRVKKILSNRKLSFKEREKVVLVCRPDGEIVWIPGVRRAQFGIVTPDSHKLLRLECSTKS